MRFEFVSALLIGTIILAAGLISGASADVAHKHYRSGPQVRGYAIRRGGGYSYSHADTINTYGYGTAAYRDHMRDRQTPGGPFDSGFFFDSAIGLNGGNAPYMH